MRDWVRLVGMLDGSANAEQCLLQSIMGVVRACVLSSRPRAAGLSEKHFSNARVLSGCLVPVLWVYGAGCTVYSVVIGSDGVCGGAASSGKSGSVSLDSNS